MTHNSIAVSAPGKLHLLGEHSVVYGQPAIISAVNKRCMVTFQKDNNASYQDFRFCHSREGGNPAQQIHKSESSVYEYIDVCLKEAFTFFDKRKSDGCMWTLQSISSNIPLGSGMGSSAAVAVAIAGAVSQAVSGKLRKEQINEIAFRCEKYIHGNPSGGDNTACTYGGLIWYQKKSDTEKIMKPLPFSISGKISSRFSIINTGKPVESTGEMVSAVAERIKEKKEKCEKIFIQQGTLVEQILDALKSGNIYDIKQIITSGEKNLEQLGVVSESTKRLIRKIESVGGAAKICGAGGRKKASGIVLAFHDNFAKIQEIAQGFDLPSEKVLLGEEGVRLELRIKN